jgi:hypothetical protein
MEEPEARSARIGLLDRGRTRTDAAAVKEEPASASLYWGRLSGGSGR